MPIPPELVWLALEQLQNGNLLLESVRRPDGLIDMSRRQIVQRLGKAALAVLPVVAMVSIPAAKAHLTTGGGCVVYETPILEASGSKILAGDVEVGQELLGADYRTGMLRPAKVKSVFKNKTSFLYELSTDSGKTLRCSDSHLIMTGDSSVGKRASELQLGDSILVHNPRLSAVVPARAVSLEVVVKEEPVVTFEMESVDHTYVSGGILSHNKPKR